MLPMQGAQILSLVGKLRSWRPTWHGRKKKKKKKKSLFIINWIYESYFEYRLIGKKKKKRLYLAVSVIISLKLQSNQEKTAQDHLATGNLWNNIFFREVDLVTVWNINTPNMCFPDFHLYSSVIQYLQLVL